MIKHNYHILSGGPGSGKTSVLNEIANRKFEVVREVAREIIISQREQGGCATHDGDQGAFRELMFLESLSDYKKHTAINTPIFFDRGIADIAGYSLLIDMPLTQNMQHAIDTYKYNPNVFFFQPWEQIYKKDSERHQDFSEAKLTYKVIKSAYVANNYHIVEVPFLDVKSRVDFILDTIKIR